MISFQSLLLCSFFIFIVNVLYIFFFEKLVLVVARERVVAAGCSRPEKCAWHFGCCAWTVCVKR